MKFERVLTIFGVILAVFIVAGFLIMSVVGKNPVKVGTDADKGNNGTYIPAAPSVNSQGGIYDHPIDIIITDTNGNWPVYYTLDGSEPNSGSLKYEAPIHLDSGKTVLKAAGISPEGLISKILVQEYDLTSVAAMVSPMPEKAQTVTESPDSTPVPDPTVTEAATEVEPPVSTPASASETTPTSKPTSEPTIAATPTPAAASKETPNPTPAATPTPTPALIKTASLKLGDYAYFGEYLKEPILWRVINIDANGNLVLFSEKIISYKAFDAAESGVWGSSSSYTDNQERQNYGSNNWECSNLREWLNSSSQTVKFNTQPPVKDAVYSCPYADEPGFLTNFTKNEINLIQAVSHPVCLANPDIQDKDGGGALFSMTVANPSKALSNEAEAFYENVTDKVYLLSIEEVAQWVEARGYEWRRGGTQSAKNQAGKNKSGVNNYFEFGGFGLYYLRSPVAENGTGVRLVQYNGDVMKGNAVDGAGIAPALTLDAKSILFESGNGSAKKPYKIKR